MARLEQTHPSLLPALREHIERSRHDLGKYISFQARNLPDPPSDQELREALVADLRETRRSGANLTDAETLWGTLRPSLSGQAELPDGGLVDLAGDPDFEALCRAMARVSAAIPLLHQASRAELGEARAQARLVSECLSSLSKRVRLLCPRG